ncbi:MAG: four helix bundle protein [Bacteroidaceae bacterium]|nr:four helix bundle protein [Bacteroidaceae bacterium]
MRNFREFTFWKDAVLLAKDICIYTRRFPSEERYALGDQLRRACISIASNIAEGAGRSSDSDFAHFLDIALESSYEVETQIYIAELLNYFSKEERQELINRVKSIQRRISSFIIGVRKG